MVVPGANNVETYYSLKLATQFGSENVDPSKYYNATTPVVITGATTGVEGRGYWISGSDTQLNTSLVFELLIIFNTDR